MHDVICAQNCNVGKITVNVSQKSEKAKNRIYEIFPWISVRWSNDVETDFIACWGKPVQAVADPKILKMGGGAEDNLLAPSLMRTTKYMPFTRKKAAFWKKNYTIGGGRPQAPPPLNPPLSARRSADFIYTCCSFPVTYRSFTASDVTNCISHV